MKHISEVINLSKHLQTADSINLHEAKLRAVESNIIRDNHDMILQTAREVGNQLINSPALPKLDSHEQACLQRYIYVPILYKLGYTTEAADVGQKTFEFLFPALHTAVSDKLTHLFHGNNLHDIQQKTLKQFMIYHPDIQAVYGRLKSTNSIWKKLVSLAELHVMSNDKFAHVINDFMALRWNMRVNKNENRYDALLNGVKLVPKKGLFAFRNQMLLQSSGFSREPVMKFYYLWENIPVELQLLGGKIENYMCAKGYSSYKTGMGLDPGGLTEDQRNARLGMCLSYSENDRIPVFRKLMLDELITEKPLIYDTRHSYILNAVPINSDNLQLRFNGSDRPVYLLDNFDGPF